jgi:hypothetical protein
LEICTQADEADEFRRKPFDITRDAPAQSGHVFLTSFLDFRRPPRPATVARHALRMAGATGTTMSR